MTFLNLLWPSALLACYPRFPAGLEILHYVEVSWWTLSLCSHQKAAGLGRRAAARSGFTSFFTSILLGNGVHSLSQLGPVPQPWWDGPSQAPGWLQITLLAGKPGVSIPERAAVYDLACVDVCWHSCPPSLTHCIFLTEEFGQGRFRYQNNLFILLFGSLWVLGGWCWKDEYFAFIADVVYF